MEETIDLKEFIFETYKKSKDLFKRDKVIFMFPTWYKEEVINQANELGFDYEVDETNFDIFSGLVNCVHMTITVESMLPNIEDLY